MRFCPFCAQENTDDARECGHCGKRLPAPRAAPQRPVSAPPVVERPRPAPRPAPRPVPRARPTRPDPAPTPDPSSDEIQTLKPPPLTAQTSPARAAPASAPPPAAAPTRPPAAAQAPTLPAPPMRVPKRTLLGVPVADPATSELTIPTIKPNLKPDHTDRRETKPLNVKTAADALKAPAGRSTSPLGAPLLHAPSFDEDEEEATTVENPKLSEIDSRPIILSDRSASTVTPLPPPPPVERVRRPVPAPRDPSAALVPIVQNPTPVMPIQAVPPMPTAPKPDPLWSSLLHSVLYLPPLVKAVLARRKVQKGLRTLLIGDQKLLDQVLRELGRAARENEVEAPAIAEEMRRVRAEEERRRGAEHKMRSLDEKMVEEKARWATDEAERKADLDSRENEMRAWDEESKRLGGERRMHESVRDKIDNLIRAAEKRATQAEAKAVRAETTPPEKGGGPNTAANARNEATAARAEATSHIPARDQEREKMEALDAPLAALAKQISDGRAVAQLKRKEMAEALTAHKLALTALEAERKQCETDRDGAEREMSLRFVAAGTLLNLNRVEDPRMAPLYARIDELRGGVNAREAAIVRLDTELRSYDRAAVQKGLLVVGGTFATIILLAIVLLVVIAR